MSHELALPEFLEWARRVGPTHPSTDQFGRDPVGSDRRRSWDDDPPSCRSNGRTQLASYAGAVRRNVGDGEVDR
jgi:hypothetical protein